MQNAAKRPVIFRLFARLRQPAFALILTFMTLGSAQAQEITEVEVAIKLCLDLPQNDNDTFQKLIEEGWSNDADAAFRAFLSGVFAFNFNPEDLSYSIYNASFMAASLLGNSSPRPNPVGFSNGDLKLTILKDNPTCILSGPPSLFDILVAHVEMIETARSDFHRVLSGEAEGHTIDAVILDRAAISPKLAEVTLQYIKENDFTFDDINIVIRPVHIEEATP